MDQALAFTWQVEPGLPATAQVEPPGGPAGAAGWLASVRPRLIEALHEYGAVYIRGLKIADVEDFAAIRDALMTVRTPYREKATPRSRLGDEVFSSTDLPPSQPIRMHNENSYTLTFPGLLMFGCLVAPPEGGATPVADCRKVLAELPERLVDKMRRVGWRLDRSYSDRISTSWQTAFGTERRDEVERYCREQLISFAWRENALRTSQLRPGLIEHPVTGAAVWFNHLMFWNEWALDPLVRETLVDEFGADALPFNTAFGDGEPLTQGELDVIERAYDSATVRRPWEPGDLLLVDNVLTAHGRDPFRGERRIVVAMGDPVRLADCKPTVAPAAPLEV